MEDVKRRNVYLSIAAVVIFCVFCIGILSLFRSTFGRSVVFLAVSTPTPTPDPMAPKNILLLGYGGRGHDGGLLTDTMIVAHIRPREKRLILISIPRDLWVQVEAKTGEIKGFKINAVYAIGSDNRGYPDKPDIYQGSNGGPLMAKDTVEKVTGLPIEFAVAVDFSGFVKLIDILGGVFIDVPFTFEDKWYPLEGKEKETCDKSDEEIKDITATMSGKLLEEQFPCRYETLTFEKGKLFMDGGTALKFVRSRHSDINGGDFGRSQRQQAFLLGVKNRLLSFSGATKIIPLFSEGLKMVQTDITLKDITRMVELYGSVSSYSIDAIPLTDQNALTFSTSTDGQYILIPKTGEEDWGSIALYITNELTKMKNASPSSVIQ